MHNIRTIMHAETQRGNQKPYIEGQTIQWPKEKGQKDNDLQNTTQKTKARAIRTPLKTGSKLM